MTSEALTLRDTGRVNAAFLHDVLEGLAQPQKAIAARWFYDRRGSELFEQITRLPEYYLTRTEIGLLRDHAAEVGRCVGSRVVVEFGSGSSRKTPLLLNAMKPLAYVPIDISGEFLQHAADALAAIQPGLDIFPLEGDFTHPLKLPAAVAGKPALGFFPGSTIGNFSAANAVDLLRAIGETLGPDLMLLIGIDGKKPVDRLIRAYDDAAGITARFNLNLLHRINRELGGNIPVDAFCHHVIWNEKQSRIEMHLKAMRAIDFRVYEYRYSMAAGETIHTENSHKYDVDEAHLLLRAAGWTPLMTWVGAKEVFGLYLTERTAPSLQD